MTPEQQTAIAFGKWLSISDWYLKEIGGKDVWVNVFNKYHRLSDEELFELFKKENKL